MINNYKRKKINSTIQSKYCIENELNNLESLVKYKLKQPQEVTSNDPLIQEILSVIL